MSTDSPAPIERICALVQDDQEDLARSTYGDDAVDAVLEEHALAMLTAFGAISTGNGHDDR